MIDVAPVIVPWLVFGAWWGVRSLQADRAVRVEQRRRWPLLITIVAAAVATKLLPGRILPRSAALYWAGIAVEIAGVGFAIWAREHLGRVWSSLVTLKEDHRLIRSGPYGVVRHPIYTGALTGLLGLALAMGTASAFIAFVGMTVEWSIKLRVEERLLTEHFGDEYREYQRQVPALVPRPWRRVRSAS
jgi:protein-S-isoprenylcysteine O-methyltransferase Ste14